MALNIGELYATLKLDATGARDGLTKFGQSAKSMGDSVGKVGASLTKSVTLPIMAIGTAVGVGAVKLIAFGSDAMEMDSKFKTVFGSMSGEADKWASNFREKVGGSTVDIKTVMADSMDLMAGMQATGAEGLAMAQKMQMLGTDLASFQNVEGGATVATEKLRAGLLGETENLKSLGIMVNETTIAQQMAENGDKRKFQSLSELEKMEVRMQIATKQSKNAIGDAVKTSDGYANTVRDLQGRFKDLVTEISIKFLPIAMQIVNYMVDSLLPAIETYILPAVDKFIKVIGKIAEWFTNLDGRTKAVVLGFGAFVVAIGPLLSIIGTLITLAGTVATVIAFLATPMGLVVIAIVALIAIGVALWQNWDTVVQKFSTMKIALMTTITNLKQGFIDGFTKIGAWVTNFFSKWGATILAVLVPFIGIPLLIYQNWDKLRNWFTIIKNAVVAVFNAMVQAVIAKFNSMKATATSIVNGIKNAIVGAFTSAKNTVVSIASNIYSSAMGKFNSLKSGVTGVFNSIKSVVSGSINAVKNTFNALRLNFPKIKLPYFTIKGKFSLKPLTVPYLAMGWKAKGGIFDQPSIIGLGERGREAVVPLQGQAGNMFAQAFIDRIQGLGGSFAMGGGITVNINGDVKNPAQFARMISREIQLETDRKTRARGR